MKRIAFLILAALICAPVAHAQEGRIPTPFGLKWGMTQAQVQNAGVVLEKDGDAGQKFSKNYTTKSVPKNLRDADVYYLTFAPEGGLVEIVATSEQFFDANVSNAKARYKELKDNLTAKYGSPADGEEAVRDFAASDEIGFFGCLAQAEGKCGVWWSFWQPKDGYTVVLSLEGREFLAPFGYYYLRYRSPGFFKMREKEKDAL